MLDIEIRGFKFFENDNGKQPYHSLGFADICIPDLEITIREVLLTWDAKKGHRARAPFALAARGIRAVEWRQNGDFARLVARKMFAAFEALGGKLPDAVDGDDDSGVRRVLRDKS